MASSVLSLLLLAALPCASAAPAETAATSAAYDYIVVGGGTAGAALATRLSQKLSSASVLLLEAGPDGLNEPKIFIPGMKGSTIGSSYDWNLTTVAQPGANNRVLTAPRGKVLGGSSAMNLMTWDRASSAEYDAWEQLGNPGWNWAAMIARMQRAENFTRSPDYGTTGVGDSGPINTVINRVIPEHQKLWIPTVQSLGIAHNLESLGGNPLGVMYQPSNIDPIHYNRSYAANEYIPLAGSNLRVLTNTKVVKVNLQKQGANQVATGVTLENGSVINAKREVILSAGSLLSPGLLELSGIGQKSVLAAAGINQIIDLPGVGENLQDHLRVQTSYQLKKNYTSVDILRYNATAAAEQLSLWYAGEKSLYDYTGSGYSYYTWDQVVSSAESASLTALAQQVVGSSSSVVDQRKLKYLTTNENTTVPQLEVIFSDGFTGTKGYPASTSPLFGEGFFTLIAAIMHPLSKGSVHINSSNSSAKPTINPNYLSNEYDIQALVTALKYARKIASTAPLSSAWVSEYEPGLDAVQTDAQWREYALNTAVSIYHPVGTCAMLPKNQSGVVDSNLRVYGTSNLRVVDASIMPVLLSAHIQTAVYGIAEMAADLISSQS